jgi:hypothetical protein
MKSMLTIKYLAAGAVSLVTCVGLGLYFYRRRASNSSNDITRICPQKRQLFWTTNNPKMFEKVIYSSDAQVPISTDAQVPISPDEVSVELNHIVMQLNPREDLKN